MGQMIVRLCALKFQSAPPARRATPDPLLGRRVDGVSIRAPRAEGDPSR